MSPRSPHPSVRLEPFAGRHLGCFERLLDDPDVIRFTRFPDPAPADYPRAWLDRYEAGRRDGTREAFAAVDDDGTVVGIALAPEIDRVGRELELGYVVDPTARGHGVGSELLRCLTRWAFDDFGALRAGLIIDRANGASERIAERCGYVLEGVMRSAHVKNGIRADQGIWSRLPSDPDPSAGGRASRADPEPGAGGRASRADSEPGAGG